MTTDSDVLRPCPFCGGDDSLQGFAATRVQLRRILAVLEGNDE